MSALTRRLLAIAVSAFLIVGCEGDDGAAGAAGTAGADGADGADGSAGAAGADGAAGLACWDLNEDGVADPEEDLNGDGNVDVLDCREPLPGEDIAVSGTVANDAGAPLDRFTAVWFVPAGGGEAIAADIAVDGSYTAELDEGDYDAYAARPGYEDVMSAFSVTQAGPNALDFSLPEIPDGEYITSAQCGVCHTAVYNSFKQTGHPFKLNKVIDDQQPTYPFTTLNGVLERIADDGADIAGGLPDTNGIVTDNPLGTPATWADVSYVIGGYFWKARFVDQNGSIVTGTEVQYNFATDAMSAYHNNEADKNYNCGNCHTTGWVHTDDGELGQDGLEFLQGTFSEGGVHCEACHAAGSKHAKILAGIVRDAVPRTFIELTAEGAGFGLAVACGECHTRDGERDYSTYLSGYDKALAAADPPVADPRPNEMGGRIAAKGGLIRHHEQYDEILGIDPDTLLTTRSEAFLASHGNCGNCHNPHGSSVNVNNPLYTGVPGVDPTNDGCLKCHGNPDPAKSYDLSARLGLGMRDLMCSDCHMPDLAKSATSVAGAEDRPAVGDVRSHIFSIALDSEQSQFNEAGSFAYPAIDEDWACRTCHNSSDTGIIFSVPDGFVDTYVFHDNIED